MIRRFEKPPTTYQEQLTLLRQRWMDIDDPADAEFYLKHLNYYRLAAYGPPFESSHKPHAFKPGTRFSDVLNLYVFDRELRLLVLDAIERIEVSVRGVWAYEMAHRHGAHAHLNAGLADDMERWRELIDKTRKEVDRSDEDFIRHMKKNYKEELPPVWAICEVISLGLLSQWFNNFAPASTRKAIARTYGVDEILFASWLRHITLLRNTCAHHSRLWNRVFKILPMLPRSRTLSLTAACVPGSRKIYNSLSILLHLMSVVSPHHGWRTRLTDLLAAHHIPVKELGFPEGWQEHAIWREAAA